MRIESSAHDDKQPREIPTRHDPEKINPPKDPDLTPNKNNPINPKKNEPDTAVQKPIQENPGDQTTG